MPLPRSRRWVFTLNNYTEAERDDLSTWFADGVAKYLVFGNEVGDNGTVHLQGFCVFKLMRSLAQVKTHLPRAHWEMARGTSAEASDYCKKDGIFTEYGVIHKSVERNDITAATQALVDGARFNDVAQEHASVYVKYSRGLRDFALTLNQSYEHFECRGLWIHGAPGKGKSRYARTYGDVYLKMQNKWFDGYNGEDVILLDDLDSANVGLFHYLKIWSDRYACKGETKGGTVHLSHKLFIVTSNWSIDELFRDSALSSESTGKFVTALKRRFIIYDFNMFPIEVGNDDSNTWMDFFARHYHRNSDGSLFDPNESISLTDDSSVSDNDASVLGIANTLLQIGRLPPVEEETQEEEMLEMDRSIVDWARENNIEEFL